MYINKAGPSKGIPKAEATKQSISYPINLYYVQPLIFLQPLFIT
jgi:hypothetical protein